MPDDRFLDTNILLYAYDLDAQGEDIDCAKLYEELTGELARINIEFTLQLRSAKDGSGDSAESKKTPVRNVCGALRRNRSLYRESQSEPKP